MVVPLTGGAPEDVVWLEGGPSHVGTDRPVIAADGEGPARRIWVEPFGIERFAVTNRRFAAFVETTGYITEAERLGDSFVFFAQVDSARACPSPVKSATPWWLRIEGASWRQPEGSETTTEGREDHPVVHVSWNDASAFAAWVGGRLPTEPEWEIAARGGRDYIFPWGNEEPEESGKHCNIWQGAFPMHNTGADGFLGTAPVHSFEPNGLGLFNMAGNVWEWCLEPFRVQTLAPRARTRNRIAQAADEYLLKGGSFLCHRNYCHRYRIAARMGSPPDSTASNVGFRIVYG